MYIHCESIVGIGTGNGNMGANEDNILFNIGIIINL